MSLLSKYLCRKFCSKSVFQPITFKHTKDFTRHVNSAEVHPRKGRKAALQNQSHEVITSISRSVEDSRGKRLRQEWDKENNLEKSISRSVEDSRGKRLRQEWDKENNLEKSISRSVEDSRGKRLRQDWDKENNVENGDRYNENRNFKNRHHQFQDHSKSRKQKSFSRQNYEDILNDDNKEIIFGIFPIYLALLAQQRTFFEIICKKGLEMSNENVIKILQLAEEKGVRVRLVPLNVIRSVMPAGVVHQNICSVVSPLPVDAYLPPEQEVQSTNNPMEEVCVETLKECSTAPEKDLSELSVLLDDVVDPMNMGAILRSCCYFGVNRVFITHSCSPINALVSKASAGAVELLKVSMMPRPEPSLEYLKSIGFKILATSSEQENSAALNLEDFKPTQKTLLILGNESRGVSSSLLSSADVTLKVSPVGANAQLLASLNVSTAAAVVLHALSSKK